MELLGIHWVGLTAQNGRKLLLLLLFVAAVLLGRFDIQRLDFAPRVFFRLIPDWLEMTARFVVRDHGTRAVKDKIARGILDGLDAAGIPVATARRSLAALPPVEVREALRPPQAKAG